MPVSLVLEAGCDRCGAEVLTVHVELACSEPVSSEVRRALAASGWGWEGFVERVFCPSCLSGLSGRVLRFRCEDCRAEWPVTLFRREGVEVAPRGEQFCPSCGEYGSEVSDG